MAELAQKLVNTKKSNIYVLTNVNDLESYLTNYIISKETFGYNKDLNAFEKNLLLNYHDEAKERADRLVTDDEFVGMTYDNLDIISKLIKKM